MISPKYRALSRIKASDLRINLYNFFLKLEKNFMIYENSIHTLEHSVNS